MGRWREGRLEKREDGRRVGGRKAGMEVRMYVYIMQLCYFAWIVCFRCG